MSQASVIRAVRSGPVWFFTLLKGGPRTGPVYFLFIYYETGTGTGKNRSINLPTWNRTGPDRSRTGLIMTGPELVRTGHLHTINLLYFVSFIS